MSKVDMDSYARTYSKAFDSGYSPWKTSYEEMAKKTVLKKVLKYSPMKSDFVRGIVQDETIKTDISDDMYSVPNEAVYDAEFQEVEKDDAKAVDTEVHS